MPPTPTATEAPCEVHFFEQGEKKNAKPVHLCLTHWREWRGTRSGVDDPEHFSVKRSRVDPDPNRQYDCPKDCEVCAGSLKVPKPKKGAQGG